MRRFDKKFGPDLIATIPTEPGVYRFFDEAGVVVYVGKAKNLRKRLSQYRAAVGRRGKKPRIIVKEAVAIEWEVFPSELDACLAEVRLIQTLRPRQNVASAFEFLYPMVGVRSHRDTLRFCYTTSPALFPDYTLHGAFRSRDTTGEAFFALMRLLRWVGHPEPRKSTAAEEARDEHSWVFGFRRLPSAHVTAWNAFFRGEHDVIVADLACKLLDKPSARAKASEVQTDLRSLQRFFEDEASVLRRAVAELSFPSWPVPQAERDPLFLRVRMPPRAVGGNVLEGPVTD